MSYRENFAQIAASYIDAKNRRSMSQVRTLFKNLVQTSQTNPDIAKSRNILVKFGTGIGGIANVPWIAFLDYRETNTTAKGLNVVYLFKADMTGIYLTLNQGVGKTETTSPSQEYIDRLSKIALEFRQEFKDMQKYGFVLDNNVNLASEGNTPKAYERATILHKYYDVKDLPDNFIILQDLVKLINAYSAYMDKHIFGSPLILNSQRDEVPDVNIPNFVKNANLNQGNNQFQHLTNPEMFRIRDIVKNAELCKDSDCVVALSCISGCLGMKNALPKTRKIFPAMNTVGWLETCSKIEKGYHIIDRQKSRVIYAKGHQASS